MIEHSNRNRIAVSVPTPAEHAEAARRGKPLTRELLDELRQAMEDSRLQAKTARLRRSPPSDPGSIEQLKRRIAALQQENAVLKLKIMRS